MDCVPRDETDDVSGCVEEVAVDREPSGEGRVDQSPDVVPVCEFVKNVD